MIKKICALTAIFIFTSMIAITVSAKPISNQCSGDLVINVTYHIENSMDSGEGGNYWAYDFINRLIQVRQVDENKFCAEVRDTGYFITVEGRSPGNTDNIEAGIEGRLNGGYVIDITGVLNSDPDFATFGNIGEFDYQCHPEIPECESAFNWLDTYFESGYSYAYQQWGWIYHAGKNGTWINSSDGNSGDITD